MNVVLFFPEASGTSAQGDALSAALSLQGFAAQYCHSDTEAHDRLRELQTRDARVVLVLSRNSRSSCQTAAYVRAVFPRTAILAQLDPHDEAGLVEALQSGIDAWVPACASSLLLLEALRSLMRRWPQGAAHAPVDITPIDGRRWELREHGWRLRSPQGGELALTTNERALFQCLFAAQDRRASHSQLLQAIGQSADGEEDEHGRLGVAVSRLRRKAVRQGLELPLKSVHNWGYMFAGLV